MHATQKGFTLIELMIVVAIMGILSANALPAYEDYVTRSKILESLQTLAAGKTSVSEYRSSHGVFPSSAGEAGFNPSPTAYVSAGTWDATHKRLEVTLRGFGVAAVDAKHVYMAPTGSLVSSEVTRWTCGTDIATGDYKYLPADCRSASPIGSGS